MRVLGILLVILSIIGCYSAPDCKFSLNSVHFDLTPLFQAEDFKAVGKGFEAYTYYANVCGNTHQPSPCAGAVCQYHNNGQYVANLGRWETLDQQSAFSLIDPLNPEQGVQLNFHNGDVCYGLGMGRVSHIEIQCDRDTFGTREMEVLDDHNGCVEPGYRFSIRSCHGCPGGCKLGTAGLQSWHMSAFSKFFALGFVGLAAYFILGIIFMRKYVHKDEDLSWADSIPHKEFWKSTPGLVKDGCVFSYHKLSELVSWAKKMQGGEAVDPEAKNLLDDEDLDDDAEDFNA